MRDRATLYLKQIAGQAGGAAAITSVGQLSAKNLEESLHRYLEGPMDAPFDLVGPKPCPIVPSFLNSKAGKHCQGVMSL